MQSVPIPVSFPDDVELLDVEGIPVSLGNVPGLGISSAAWDTDPPRIFPPDSAHRNGGPISAGAFKAWVREIRSKAASHAGS